MSRYARQMILPEVGAAGQERLARSHVLIVGAGGLGSPVLQYLGGAGVGCITVMDGDKVEESNLHRQVLYTMGDLGQPKAAAARRHLLAANPSLHVTARVDCLDAANAAAMVDAADLVVDAADSFAVSYILSDTCRAQGKMLISASALGQSGYAGGFCGGGPSLRAVFPDLPAQAATCATAGVMGPAVGMIGALQAQLALKSLLDHQPSPRGQLFVFRLQDLQVSSFCFDEAEEPADALPFVAASHITAADTVIELRDAAEAPGLPAFQARRIARADLLAAELPRKGRIVLCCRTGLRAWGAASDLKAAGFGDLALLAAGGSA
ncbi:HesA/MoeB/ThiF family protein [Leisingera sp. HS039]|uniref:HesA/MoeB/ThiF family protein n=1 Tax=unclassified Leisingera TaxID=2614906 RepID=UPI00107102C9|nr:MULTISPECIES: HesA/MoeB/ThiF family protein [unclassified Leisingera]MBQ4826376.1 HesA/MoeB/ThiF family protein [Leisingera sp. HS039]QBR35786.1 HesA/MoeB/ThiF family protein [Leisingera sp. NJS201]